MHLASYPQRAWIQGYCAPDQMLSDSLSSREALHGDKATLINDDFLGLQNSVYGQAIATFFIVNVALVAQGK